MAKVKKLNRILSVDDRAVESYLKQGYDEIDDKGRIVRRATGGRDIPVAEYNKVLTENEELKAKVKELEKKLKGTKVVKK